MRRKVLVFGAVLVFIPGVALAQPQGGGDGGLIRTLFSPFRQLAQVMIDTLIDVLATSPTIKPNPAVETIHRLTLPVAYLSSGLILAAAGLEYIFGPELGIPYREVRLVLPRLVIALVFAPIALQLLQLGVEVSNVFVQVFRPPDPIELEQLAGLSTGLVLAWFINSWALLALVLLFVIRKFYLLFLASISPLVAVAWSLPNTRRYADSLISLWFVALAVAPLDLLVLRFNLAMLQASGAFGLQPVSNWILGTASFVLMLWIPYQLYRVSLAYIGSSSSTASDIGSAVGREGGSDEGSEDGIEEHDRRQRRERRRRDRRRR